MTGFLDKITSYGSYAGPDASSFGGGSTADAGAGGFLSGLFGGGGGDSIWSNPTVLSSAILAGTSLFSGLFGNDSGEMEQKQYEATLAENQRQFDAKMALEQQQLAQSIELAKIQAGAAGAGASASRANAAAARDAALRQAKIQAIGEATKLKSQALTLPLEYMNEQARVAQNAGAQSGGYFSNMMQSLQQPALRSAQ